MKFLTKCNQLTISEIFNFKSIKRSIFNEKFPHLISLYPFIINRQWVFFLFHVHQKTHLEEKRLKIFNFPPSYICLFYYSRFCTALHCHVLEITFFIYMHVSHLSIFSISHSRLRSAPTKWMKNVFIYRKRSETPRESGKSTKIYYASTTHTLFNILFLRQWSSERERKRKEEKYFFPFLMTHLHQLKAIFFLLFFVHLIQS